MKRTPREPFFGINAIPWLASAVAALLVWYLGRKYIGPIIDPYDGQFVQFIWVRLGLQ